MSLKGCVVVHSTGLGVGFSAEGHQAVDKHMVDTSYLLEQTLGEAHIALHDAQ